MSTRQTANASLASSTQDSDSSFFPMHSLQTASLCWLASVVLGTVSHSTQQSQTLSSSHVHGSTRALLSNRSPKQRSTLHQSVSLNVVSYPTQRSQSSFSCGDDALTLYSLDYALAH